MVKYAAPLVFLVVIIAYFIFYPANIAARQQRPTRIISPIAKASPTLTPSLTPTSTLKPTSEPTATPKLASPDASTASQGGEQGGPTGTPTSIPSTNKQAYIISQINQYRQSKGLSTITTDPYTCAFAKTRAEEIASNFNHTGFRQRIDSGTLPYPSWSSVTENIAMNPDYKGVVDQWINSPSHAQNMEKDTPYVCVEWFGNYYAYEGWKP